MSNSKLSKQGQVGSVLMQWLSNCGMRTTSLVVCKGFSDGTRTAFLSYSKSFVNSFVCYANVTNSFMCYINLKYIWENYVLL